MSVRPDYSPREVHLLRNGQFDGTAWETAEERPRKVAVLGRAAIDPDVFVVRIDGVEHPQWLMACGNGLYDGSIVNMDGLWVRECMP